MRLSHRPNTTLLPVGLEEITEAIYHDLDVMVLRIGERLQTAFDEYPALYERWVTECLPFGLDAARRMRMVWKASLALPPSTLAALPRPWQAAYALTRLPVGVLTEAVATGKVNPGLTVRQSVEVARTLSGRTIQRFSDADLIAGRLLGHPVEALSDDVRELLASWLAG